MQLLLRRLWIQITSDRKRFGLLCAMVAVGMLLWARIIVTTNLPRTVIADPKDPEVENVQRAPSDKRRWAPVTVQLARTAPRDPLVISEADFPQRNDVGPAEQENGKFRPEEVENVEQAESRLVAELRSLASRFKLEGVMQGRPMAVINGRMYQLDDWIPAVGNAKHFFQLVEVGSRWVDLECEEHRFRVTMDNPGNEKR